MKMRSNSNGGQQKYKRVPQPGSSNSFATSTNNEQQDSESQFELTESHHVVGSTTDTSLQDDEFVDDHIDSDTMPSIRSDKSSILEANCEDAQQLQPYTNSRYSYACSLIKRMLTTNLADDKVLLNFYRHMCRAGEEPIIDDGGLIMIKLIKFWALSITGIILMHPLARLMDWEIDDAFSLNDFILFDFSTVLLDLTFFFFVGRLYSCRGIDYLYPWGIFITLGAVYASIANEFDFLRHHISMYDMMCGWPVILFIYAIVLVLMAMVLGVALIRSHHCRNVLRSRIVESIVLTCLFILPYATDDSFHLHHWYGMWFLGMQANAPELFSRSFQAYALGSYINGIAVYGRDPILTCKYSFYLSTNLECDYMQCYGQKAGGNGTFLPFVTGDWRKCNAESLREESFTWMNEINGTVGHNDGGNVTRN